MATRKRTRAKIEATINAGNDNAERLYRGLELADMVSPGESEEQKAVAKLLAILPKDDPAYTILADKQNADSQTGDVDIYEVFREVCQLVGLTEAKAMAKCIGKMVGDKVSSEWKVAGEPEVANGDTDEEPEPDVNDPDFDPDE